MLKMIWLTAFGLLASSAHAADYNGEDITRPVTRFDTRIQGQNGAGNENGNTATLTLRVDSSIPMNNGWKFGLRFDAPFQAFRCPHHHKGSDCYNSNHMDDALAQLYVITPNYGKYCFAAGFKMLFPTAGKNLEIGDGKYQLLPSVAFRCDLDELSAGSYYGAILREDWSVAGYSSAKRISRTYLKPFININLPRNWFLNSSPELFYDWVIHKWFIPFDLMIGKMITPKLIVSLEYEYGLVYGHRSYRNQLEFRIGVFF